MEEASAALETEAAQASAEKAETYMDTVQPESKAADERAMAEASATATTAQQNEPEKNVKADKQVKAAAAAGNQPVPGTGGELNFDSMLPDASGGTNAFDLNLDFSNGEIGNQNFLSGSNFGNSASNAQGKDQGGSISSLLPELESYAANAGDDFNVELQQVGNDTSQQQQQPQPQQAQQQQNQQQQQQQQQQPEAQKDKGQEEVMAPGESSFDDLFMENDNVGGEGNENMMGGDGMMDIGELDDAWFTWLSCFEKLSTIYDNSNIRTLEVTCTYRTCCFPTSSRCLIVFWGIHTFY